MELSKRNWMARLQLWVGFDRPNNLCRYFWQSVASLVALPLIALVNLIAYPFKAVWKPISKSIENRKTRIVKKMSIEVFVSRLFDYYYGKDDVLRNRLIYLQYRLPDWAQRWLKENNKSISNEFLDKVDLIIEGLQKQDNSNWKKLVNTEIAYYYNYIAVLTLCLVALVVSRYLIYMTVADVNPLVNLIFGIFVMCFLCPSLIIVPVFVVCYDNNKEFFREYSTVKPDSIIIDYLKSVKERTCLLITWRD